MNKRYRVVQDARGFWGIHDASAPREESSFAKFSPSGSARLDMIVDVAVDLNRRNMKYLNLNWTWYYPRKEVRS